MGKRSDFERRKHDKYMTTDKRPIARLQPHLPRGLHYAEPCAGKGDLIKLMEWHGHTCTYAGDTRPGRQWMVRRSALQLDGAWRRRSGAKMFITNPPWSRPILHALIEHLPKLLPTWLLLDADWMHTQQAAEHIDRCSQIVSAGRVRWIEDSDGDGVDNCAWFFFPHRHHTGGPKFTGLI